MSCLPHLRRRIVRPARQGFTILELVVVIGILATLAGILVPILPNLLARSSYATAATNTGELTKELFTYRSLNGTFPDGYDVLTSGSTTAPTVVALPASAGFTVAPLAGAGATSLNNAGIKTLYDMDTDTGHATFFFSSSGGAWSTSSTSSVSGANVLQISGSNLQTLLGQGISTASNYTYVVLGIGNNCTLVGARTGGVQEAPLRSVLVNGNGNALTTSALTNGTGTTTLSPSNAYCRFVAIYKVDTNGIKPASLVCCAGLDPTAGLVFTDQLLNGYYANVKNSE